MRIRKSRSSSLRPRVGVLAASQAVKDAGKIGQVYVTGLGLPSEMAGAIKSGATKEFAIWNPIDLGYFCNADRLPPRQG